MNIKEIYAVPKKAKIEGAADRKIYFCVLFGRKIEDINEVKPHEKAEKFIINTRSAIVVHLPSN